MTTDSDLLQQMVRLTAVALGVSDVQMAVVEPASFNLCSNRRVSSSATWAVRLGYGNCRPTGATAASVSDPLWDDVEPWVRSVAVAPLTGASGEEGFLLAGHDEPDRFDDSTIEVLNRFVGLAESHFDRSAEQVRMDRLGEVLRNNQEQLRETQDRLLVSNEELEQFAYIAAHELVAPLRSVALYAEVLEPLVSAEHIDHDQVRKVISSIQTGVADMDQQVKQLLQLSNIQGDLSQFSSLDLSEVVEQAVQTSQISLSEVKAVVEVGELPFVRGRTVPLQSVFANLISNAIRYRHPSRPLKIDVSAVKRNGKAVVSVTDNGVGVHPSTHDRIFQMFERGSTATSGSGIGLALSRRIVESVGGSISLESSSDEGSTFQITLQLGAS